MAETQPYIDSWSDEVAWGPGIKPDAIENIPGFVLPFRLAEVEPETEEEII